MKSRALLTVLVFTLYTFSSTASASGTRQEPPAPAPVTEQISPNNSVNSNWYDSILTFLGL